MVKSILEIPVSRVKISRQKADMIKKHAENEYNKRVNTHKKNAVVRYDYKTKPRTSRLSVIA